MLLMAGFPGVFSPSQSGVQDTLNVINGSDNVINSSDNVITV